MSDPGDILVVGIGNILLRDEGVGVHAVRALADAASSDEADLPPRTRIVDGGTLGLDLLPLLDGARGVIFVDAVDLGLPPGTTTVIHGDEVRSTMRAARSAHDVGLTEFIETASLVGCLPRDVAVVGVQAGSISVGLDLTPPVARALPAVLDLICREAWRPWKESRCSGDPHRGAQVPAWARSPGSSMAGRSGSHVGSRPTDRRQDLSGPARTDFAIA